MKHLRGICAVVPVKETAYAKQRLAGVLSAQQRQKLALAMLEDVLAALSAVKTLAGIMLVTVDHDAMRLAAKYHARVTTAGAHDGHTGAVAAAARLLANEGLGMMEVPGDVPLITHEDIAEVLSAHGRAPAFTIVPARDDKGSNMVVCSPANGVPLKFGDDSFLPHLAAARMYGISPAVVRNARIGLDVDRRDDLSRLLATPSRTRTHALLQQWRADILTPLGSLPG